MYGYLPLKKRSAYTVGLLYYSASHSAREGTAILSGSKIQRIYPVSYILLESYLTKTAKTPVTTRSFCIFNNSILEPKNENNILLRKRGFYESKSLRRAVRIGENIRLY